MKMNSMLTGACVVLTVLAGTGASSAKEVPGQDSWAYPLPAGKTAVAGLVSEKRVAKVVPGTSTKSQVQRLLGAPWRVVQFNDCGAAMPGQADETWDYRGRDSRGSFRIHIEFDDHDVARLVAKVPDAVAGGQGTTAKSASTAMPPGMAM